MALLRMAGILISVFDWFKRLRHQARNLSLPARVERTARNTEAVDLKPYTPEPKVFLGQLAYLQLSQFEILTSELKYSPNTQYKAELSEAAAKSFEKYRAISKKIAALGIDPTDAMDPYVERIETFHSRTNGIDWFESLIKVYLVAGLLDDFYRRLAIGLDPITRADVEKALGDKKFEVFAKRVLIESMAEDPTLSHRLALWGRRLMGDVLLELRAAFDNRKLAGIAKSKKLTVEQEREVNLASYSKLEPLVTELIGAHTMRMDAVGLTA
ncbi:ferritin-like fold-containing protein [Rhodoluna sp.]|uniref:ferritin-like fold-containing protein n=1 Tax=Rhodoluna sp. TaxID=1969481 RepID=UPI0025D3A223|nr:ferritin-like fold-containing protein [Rhodoluna sp.]